ncbi:conserved Plasmodium membrane protein, unknown function [Plasmodium gallinaceum]|uniref:CSC1/OSCA1-like 7TM region domain-containing protein n=1 Tax=Plasmodium gallinaceum TaxID=5849 RepID=A0A1J1H0S1_PLAGA|nr:conserved Plasmodium membrane protein, unknown function [Plasmodium gallinaceum]CRG97130.1 conserved Plasmodium membrane protein, unknown function [Plasmodium gallinaceum]
MKSETEDFLIAFLFDIAFFGVCVGIWFYIRKNRDENKINDNIYILSQNTYSEIKVDRDSSCAKDDDNIEIKGKSNKFRTFLNIKDDKIVNTEIKYYLFFLKTNRNIIFSLCILGTFLVLPLYLSIPRDDINNPSFFNYISAGSISDINVLTILYFITLIYSAISYALIYLLWRKIRPSKKKTKKFLPQNFTIMVSRIDKNEINAYKIYKYFCNLTNNKVVSAYLILDYSIVYDEQKKIFNATKNLKLLKENEEKKNTKRDKFKKKIFFFWDKKKKKNSKLLLDTNNNIKDYNVNEKNNSSSYINAIKEKDRGIMDNKKLPLNYNLDTENSYEYANENFPLNEKKDSCLLQVNSKSMKEKSILKKYESKNVLSKTNSLYNIHEIKKSSLNNSMLPNDKSEENEELSIKSNKKVYYMNDFQNFKGNDEKQENTDVYNDMEYIENNNLDDNFFKKTQKSFLLKNRSKDNCKQICKRKRWREGFKEENYEIKTKRKNSNNVSNEDVCFLKDTSDDEETLKEDKINKINIINNDYNYKLELHDNLIRNNNSEMLFYDLENLSTKDNDNMELNYKEKEKTFESTLRTNFLHKFMFFFKKNKKSHWKKKLKEHLIKFYSIKNETPKKSTGVCFVSFIDTKSVHDCIHNIPFTERNKWIISKAPPNYDIIWKNLKNHSYKVCARFIILNALLLVANTIIIISVTSIDNILKLRVNKYREDPNSSNISSILITWLSPFIVIFVNSIVQPALIACVSIAIGFIRKSSEHTYVLQGNFIFLILNTIIIPLLSLSPLSSLIKVMYSDEIEQWSTRLREYLFNSSGFFAMRYLLHCCFLTCANQLLQIPQFSIRSIVKKITKKEIGAWTFDFGYWYGFNTSILALILTFSVAVPFILPLGSLYFFLRYYIDKYNLIYEICRTNLDSHGAVVRTAIKFMLFSVAFFQLVMFTFFSRVQNKFISVGRNILFLSSSLTTLLLLCRSTEWVSTHHIKKKKGKRTFCYLCEKNVYVSNLKDLNKLKYAYANPCESKR